LENASYVTSFSSGLGASDHNLYWNKGFVFEANYKSGLRIFDTYFDPLAPTQVGFFDTYPQANSTGFSGAWSNYPYFPSGTVIVSDINRGLFVLDVSEAITRTIAPSVVTVNPGILMSGGVTQLATSDDTVLIAQVDLSSEQAGFPITVELTSTSPDLNPSLIGFVLESRSEFPGFGQSIELYDWVAGTWVSVDYRTASTTETSMTVSAISPLERFVNQSTRQIRARLGWEPVDADISGAWRVWIDQAVWRIRP
jgi:hypothetical protein